MSASKRRSSSSSKKNKGTVPITPDTPSSKSRRSHSSKGKRSHSRSSRSSSRSRSGSNGNRNKNHHRSEGGKPPDTPSPPLPEALQDPKPTPDVPGPPIPAKPPSTIPGSRNALSDQVVSIMGGDVYSARRDDGSEESRVVRELLIRAFGSRISTGKFKEDMILPRFGIMTTAPVETVAAVTILLQEPDSAVELYTTKKWSWYLGYLPGRRHVPVVVAKSSQGTHGMTGSGPATAALLDTWPGLQMVVAVGICWGVRDDPSLELQFGDVLVSNSIQNYDWKRREKLKGLVLSAPLDHVPPALLDGLTGPLLAGWMLNDNNLPRPTRAVQGLMIASATLLNDEKETLNVLEAVRSKKDCQGMTVVGGEMEGAGLLAATEAVAVPAAVIKAVVDFGGVGELKGKEHQAFAAVAAMQFLVFAVNTGEDWTLSSLDRQVFMGKKRLEFVGREPLMARVKASSGRLILVPGDAGSGKSAFLAEFAHQAGRSVGAFHVCRFGAVETLDPRRWVQNIVGQLARWCFRNQVFFFPASVFKALEDKESSPVALFEEFLMVLPLEGPSCWIIVDSMDEAVNEGGEDILRALRSFVDLAPKWLQGLVSSRSDERVFELLGIYGIEVIGPTEAENKTDVKKWLEKYSTLRGDDVLIHRVVEGSKGNFLYTQQLMEARDGGIAIGQLKEMPADLFAVYSLQFGRAVWDSAGKFKADLAILHVLVAARSGVSFHLLDAAAKTKWDSVQTRRVVDDLASVLEQGGNGSIRVFHKSFAEWMVKEGLFGVTASVKEGDKALWAACCSLWRDEARRSEMEAVYIARHGIRHGVGAGVSQKELLKGLGDDVKWGVMKGQNDTLLNLLEDVKACGGGVVVAKAMVQRTGVSVSDLNELALHFQDLSLMEGAITLFEEARGMTARTEGKETNFYAIILTNLASVYRSQGKLAEAIALFEEALGIEAQTVGRDSGPYATTLSKLAGVYAIQGKLSEATELLEEAIGILARTVGKETHFYASMVDDLASLCQQQGKLDEAMALYNEALEIKTRTVGKETQSFATTLNGVAGVYALQGKLPESILFLEEARRIIAKTLGKETDSYATTLFNLGVMYRNQGQLSQATVLLEEARGIFAKTVGTETKAYVNTISGLGVVYALQGDLAQAISTIETSHGIYKRLGIQVPEGGEGFLEYLKKQLEDK